METPTVEQDLGPEATLAMFRIVAVCALANQMSERRDGYLLIPDSWWQETVMHEIEILNRIAREKQAREAEMGRV